MTDVKKERTLEELKTEYGKLCFRAGDLQYEISIKQKDLSLINESLRNINFEAAALQAKAAKESLEGQEAPNLLKEV